MLHFSKWFWLTIVMPWNMWFAQNFEYLSIKRFCKTYLFLLYVATDSRPQGQAFHGISQYPLYSNDLKLISSLPWAHVAHLFKTLILTAHGENLVNSCTKIVFNAIKGNKVVFTFLCLYAFSFSFSFSFSFITYMAHWLTGKAEEIRITRLSVLQHYKRLVF